MPSQISSSGVNEEFAERRALGSQAFNKDVNRELGEKSQTQYFVESQSRSLRARKVCSVQSTFNGSTQGRKEVNFTDLL